MQQSFSQFTKSFTSALERHHSTIAIVIVSLLLCLAIFRLFVVTQISNQKGVDGYAPVSKINGNFDQKTIDRIDNLRTSEDKNDPLSFPARKSPFVE